MSTHTRENVDRPRVASSRDADGAATDRERPGVDRHGGDRRDESVSSWGRAIRAAQRRRGNQAVSQALKASFGGRADDRTAPPTPDGAVPARSFEGPLGGGDRLPAPARSTLEGHFGCDLRDVRVHTDGLGPTAARAMGVSAVAVGRDVVVRPRHYDPGSRSGRTLLTHELTHVLQQGADGGPHLGRAGAERAATSAARSLGRGQAPDIGGATDVRVAPQGYSGSHAVTPETLFELLVSWRGHSVESGAGLVRPGRLSPDVEPGTQMLGRGNTTAAIVSISDASGSTLVEWGAGVSDGTNHAEVNAMKHLDTNIAGMDLGSQLRGGHVMVVVDQTVCSSCRRKLMQFVDHHDLAGVTAYTFTREKLRGSGQASPKTSMRGITRDYIGTPGRPTRQFDFSYANPTFLGDDGGGSAGSRRPRQGALFGESGESRTAGGATPGAGSDRGGSIDSYRRMEPGTRPESARRQRTLFEYTRAQSQVQGTGLSAPPAELHPAVRFTRLVSNVLEIAELADAVMMYARGWELATGLAAGEVVMLTKARDRLQQSKNRIERVKAAYEQYSTELRSLENEVLPAIANSGDLEAIWEAETDLNSIRDGIRADQGWLEVKLLPKLQAAKRELVDTRLEVREALQDEELLFALGLGGSSGPHAEVVVYHQDLVKLTGILSTTIGHVTALRDQMAADREYLRTWSDWMGDVYVQTLRELEDDGPE